MDYIVKDKGNHISLIEQEKEHLKTHIVTQYIALRKQKNLSQQDIANLTEIARPNIARIESGKHSPTLEILTKLAIALDMNLEINFTEKRE